MAKTPKPKKRESSLHSRAARRNASPPPNDTTSKTKSDATSSDTWIYAAQNAGIQKRKRKAKKLTHNQKIRQQRGLQNAERNIEKHEKKVADSKRRGKKVNNRRQEWEDLNGVHVAEGEDDEVDRKGAEEEQREELQADGGARDEREDSEGRRKGTSFAKGMAEVELKETMDELEGFGLPTVNGTEADDGEDTMEETRDEGAEAIDVPTDNKEKGDEVADVDEVL